MKKKGEYNRMAWTVEANDNIERLAQLLQSHYRRAKDKSAYRFPSAGPTPAQVPCGRSGHTPKASLWRTGGWRTLGFSLAKMFRYRYQVVSSGTGASASFTIRANADLDCDGVYSTFERTGRIKAGKLVLGVLRWDKDKELE